MPTYELVLPQIISRLDNSDAEQFLATAMQLWEALAAELIPVIGSDGFSMLYSRSVHVVQPSFPWLMCDAAPQLSSSHFDSLKNCLAGRAPAEASAACKELLLTLTEILGALIGEPITVGVLRAAWGDGASDVTGKERSVDHE